MESINWGKLELVIFDVDGTLYDQKKLRRKMMLALFLHYCIRPWRYKELLILYHFRKEREKRPGHQSGNLHLEQYSWVLTKINVSMSEVQKVVDHWILDYPNKYLKACVYPGLEQFLAELNKSNIQTAIYSDYESEKKLKSMNITVDLIVSSTDACISAFKPNPIGLNYIITELKIKSKSNCLFIGDRKELDGECAKRAAVPFFLINEDNTGKQYYNMLSHLRNC